MLRTRDEDAILLSRDDCRQATLDALQSTCRQLDVFNLGGESIALLDEVADLLPDEVQANRICVGADAIPCCGIETVAPEP